MDTTKISNLQPLFCSRAALVKAENKMNDNPDMDCRLCLQFNDGTVHPLPMQRKDIETLIASQKEKIEARINELADAAESSSDETTTE